MTFDESISGYSLFDCTLRVLEFLLGTLTWLIVLFDYLDWGFWHSDFLCASLIYFVWDIWHVDYDDWFILIEDSEIAIFCAWLPCSFEVLACWLYWLPILFRSVYWFWYLPWLFWSPCMYGFVVGLIWHVDSLACILSWSSFEHDVHIAIHPDSCSFLCGHEWYILYSA